jgi:hypothetical protein
MKTCLAWSKATRRRFVGYLFTCLTSAKRMIEKKYEFWSRSTANMMEMSTSASNILVRQSLSSTLLTGRDTIFEPAAAPMQIKTATMFSKKSHFRHFTHAMLI